MAKIILASTPGPKSIVAEEKSLDSRSIIAGKKSTYPGYTDARKKANKEWNAKQAQIAIRVKPEIKTQFDEHGKSRGESLAAFLVRAGLAQIERDTATKSVGLDKMLSE